MGSAPLGSGSGGFLFHRAGGKEASLAEALFSFPSSLAPSALAAGWAGRLQKGGDLEMVADCCSM